MPERLDYGSHTTHSIDYRWSILYYTGGPMQIDLCDEDTFLQVLTVFITYECYVHVFFDDDDDDDIEIRIGLGIGQGCFFY